MTPREFANTKVEAKSSKWRAIAPALVLIAALGFGCSKQPDAKDQALSQANDHFAAGRYEAAENEFRKVLRLAPAEPLALQRLGSIYFDQGKLRQAFPLLRQSAELQPDNLDVQLKLGQIYLSGGELRQARDAALRILNKQPGDQEALLLFADTSVALNDYQDVLKQIQELRQQDKDRPGYHLALGVIATRQGDEVRAESEFRKALELDEKSSAGYAAMGMFYWTRSDLKSADQAFKTAFNLAPLRSPVRMRYVDFLLKTGKLAEAKAIAEEISVKAPDYLPARVYLMAIACEEKREVDCAALERSVLAQDPTNPDALFQGAFRALVSGDVTRAVRELGQLSNDHPRNQQIRYQLARAYLEEAKVGDAVTRRRALERAEAALTAATQIDPNFDRATLLLADIKLKKGNPAAAVDLLIPLVKARPQNSETHFLLASAYLAQRKRDQALDVYRKMAGLFPRDSRPPLLIGTLLLEQGQRAVAREAFERSLEISPDDIAAVGKLVELDVADRQFDAAMNRVQKRIDNNPKQPEPLILRATIYLAQQDLPRAEADLLKALELEPYREASVLLLAQLYVASNRHEQAVEKLAAFVEKQKTVPALMLLALTNGRLKRFAAARDAYETILTVSPDFVAAINNLAVLYSENLDRPDIAYEHAKRAKELAPNQPHMADTLGWVLFKRGDYAGALPLLKDAAAKLPNEPEVQFHVGMAHYMVGDEEPAQAAFKKVAAAGEAPEKEEAIRRLALMAIDVDAGDKSARGELDSHLRERPNDPAALTRLGKVQEREGALDQALKTYEQVVSDHPLFAPATRRLALLYGRRATDDAKAYQQVTKARQLFPDDPEIAKTLGIMTYRRGLYPQAAVLLKDAATKLNDDFDLLVQLGESYHQIKQWKECEAVLQRALKLNPSNGFAERAKRALVDCSETER